MKNLPFIIAIVLALLLGYCGGRHGANKASPSVNDTITIRDTVVDTIPYRMPIPVDSIVLKYDYVKLPVKDTIYTKGEDIMKIDSVYVEIPISQKEYGDSTYHAWVSGYKPQLDSINVFQRTVTVTERIRAPTKRWGLGVQVGAGYNGGNKIQPYLGIGVSYNILTW